MIHGYARISDKSQKDISQTDALKKYGCDKITSETIQGDQEDKKLYKLIEKIEENDTLVVTRVDRLGRDSLQMMTYVKKIEEKKARLVIIELGIDTSTLAGKMILGMFSQIAEWDRERMAEKRRAGTEAARKRGVHLGRKPNNPISKTGLENAFKKYLDGESVNAICAEYNIPRSSFYSKIKEAGIKR
jgi:DNA invertase Pin-like site-specific DNA recombinase